MKTLGDIEAGLIAIASRRNAIRRLESHVHPSSDIPKDQRERAERMMAAHTERLAELLATPIE